MGALFDAGWTLPWAEASHFWIMAAPDGGRG